MKSNTGEIKNEIWHAEIQVKTKTGIHTDKIICIKKPLAEMQADKHVAWRITRKKNEGFKDALVIDKESGNPKIIKVTFLKYLSDANPTPSNNQQNEAGQN
jgi:hypothetical protein